MMNKLIPDNHILQKLNQYNINNSNDYIEALNVISENLNVGLKEINQGIKICQDKYEDYNFVDIFCETKKNQSSINFNINNDYILNLLELIELYLIDSEMISIKIKQVDKKNKINHLILELHKNQFYIETYLRALRDYL